MAAALVHGHLDGTTISGPGLSSPEVLRLSRSARITHFPDYDAEYPGKQTSHVVVRLTNGLVLRSDPYVMEGVQPALEMDTALDKLRAFASGQGIDADCQAKIEHALTSLLGAADLSRLSALYST